MGKSYIKDTSITASTTNLHFYQGPLRGFMSSGTTAGISGSSNNVCAYCGERSKESFSITFWYKDEYREEVFCNRECYLKGIMKELFKGNI